MKSANSIIFIIPFISGLVICPLIYPLFNSPLALVVIGTIITILGWSIKDNIDRQNNLKKLLLFIKIGNNKIPESEKNNLPSYLIRLDDDLIKENLRVRLFPDENNGIDSQPTLPDNALNDLCEKELSQLRFNSNLTVALFIIGFFTGLSFLLCFLSIFECVKSCFLVNSIFISQ